MANYTRLLKRYMNPDRIMYFLNRITTYDRMPASDGFYDAACWVRDTMRSLGVQTELLEFRADRDITYLSIPMFRQWDCRSARLEVEALDEPVLCDYMAQPMSVIMHSVAGDFRGGAEIVWLPDGFRKEDYADVDFRGRLIFSSLDIYEIADWAFIEKGAIGYVTDWMMNLGAFRSVFDVPDSRSYTRFDRRNEFTHKAFGFALTPRQGEKLRALCQRMESEHLADPSRPRYPVAAGYVDAGFRDGKMHAVLSRIPGETDEILHLSAHLCHPRPCANDDASGCAGAMEAMACAAELIERGIMPRPKYTLQMLLCPEVTGTSAYIAGLTDEERKKIRSAVHFDMIGARQGLGAGPVSMIRTPDMLPGIINEALEYCVGESIRSYRFFTGLMLPSYNFSVMDHTSGSDHQVLCDPAVGVPCPALIQWPDFHYHTSTDTPDRIDSEQIRAFAAAAAGALLSLSRPDIGTVRDYIEQTRASFEREVLSQIRIWRANRETDKTLVMRLKLKLENASGTLLDLKGLAGPDVLPAAEPLIDGEIRELSAYIRRVLAAAGVDAENEVCFGDTGVGCPRKLRMGTITEDLIIEYEDLPEYSAVKCVFSNFGVTSVGDEVNIVCYLMDGKHTVEEIGEYASIMCGADYREFASQLVDLLIRAGEAVMV